MKIISGVFHPLLMAGYMSMILAMYFPEAYAPYPQEMAWRLVIAFVMLTAFFPSLAVLGLYMFTPFVSHLELTDRKERLLPFIVLLIFYIIAAKTLVLDLDLGWVIRVLILSASGLIACLFLINTRLKISIHAAAIWAIVGNTAALANKFQINDLLIPLYLMVIVAGWVGASRLYLGYHRPKEVWAGSIFGLVFSYVVLTLAV
jgi:membrane-associated phospholipid phosphatase